jgi:hypothetical protein
MIAQGWDCTEVKGRKGAERRVEGEGKMDEDNTHWIMTPASRRRMWSKNSPLVYMSGTMRPLKFTGHTKVPEAATFM